MPVLPEPRQTQLEATSSPVTEPLLAALWQTELAES